MKIASKYRVVWMNILIAIAISLFINFSDIISVLSPSAPRDIPLHIARALRLTFFLQLLYYAVLAFALLSISTTRSRNPVQFVTRLFYCIVITFIIYFLSPSMNREGDIFIRLYHHRLFDSRLLLKCSFTLIVAVLYGKIYDLVYQKQHIIIENEQLKNENLQTIYNTLVNQISPHFFFNSLNSLAMLVREKHNAKALTYIDQLSDTFRYIIQNGRAEGTTLGEELKFVESYKYLLEIRYADKLFIDIKTEPEYKEWHLPSLSLQPLLENAVKHNIITRSQPLHISIRTHEGNLIVSNDIHPKLEPEQGTGIGLKNLDERYRLLIGKKISIENNGKTFSVILPLTDPQDENHHRRG